VYMFQVIDHYENPRNVGSLDKNDKSVGTGLVGAPACGDVMKLQVRDLSLHCSVVGLNILTLSILSPCLYQCILLCTRSDVSTPFQYVLCQSLRFSYVFLSVSSSNALILFFP